MRFREDLGFLEGGEAVRSLSHNLFQFGTLRFQVIDGRQLLRPCQIDPGFGFMHIRDGIRPMVEACLCLRHLFCRGIHLGLGHVDRFMGDQDIEVGLG